MGESKKLFRFNLDETVPTYTIGAAFTLAVVMGVIVVSGVLLKPYEAREVVASLHERIMMEKEYRELSRINYSVSRASFLQVEQSDFPEGSAVPDARYEITIPGSTSVMPASTKTDRAQSFDVAVKSDAYWHSLQASIKLFLPGSNPVVISPVIVGSAE